MRHTAAVLGVLTACSPAEPAAPARLSPPIVGDSINLGEFVGAPCRLLDAGRLTRFFITKPGVATPGTTGTECVWAPSDTTALSYHASVDNSSGGLEAVYRHRARYSVFEPATIHSYPAVHTAASPTGCTTEAGIADDTVLTVSVTVTDPKLSAYGDACGESDRFAGAAIGYVGHRAP